MVVWEGGGGYEGEDMDRKRERKKGFGVRWGRVFNPLLSNAIMVCI